LVYPINPTYNDIIYLPNQLALFLLLLLSFLLLLLFECSCFCFLPPWLLLIVLVAANGLRCCSSSFLLAPAPTMLLLFLPSSSSHEAGSRAHATCNVIFYFVASSHKAGRRWGSGSIFTIRLSNASMLALLHPYDVWIFMSIYINARNTKKVGSIIERCSRSI
jgi:hypothetical protein